MMHLGPGCVEQSESHVGVYMHRVKDCPKPRTACFFASRRATPRESEKAWLYEAGLVHAYTSCAAK